MYVHRPANTALSVAWGLQATPCRVPAQVWLWWRGQAYYDLEIAAGPDGSTAELGTSNLVRTNAGGVNEMGEGTLNW